MSKILMLSIFLLLFGICNCQDRDSTKNVAKINLPLKYSDFFNNRMSISDGLFKLYKAEDRYYLQIDDSLFERDLLVVNRIIQAPTESKNPKAMLGYAGDEIGKTQIVFSKGPGNRVFIKKKSYADYSKDSSTNGLYRSVLKSNYPAIVGVFNVKAYSADSSPIIDITDYLNNDNDVLFFTSSFTKEFYSLGAYQMDKSYVQGVKSFADNLEIKTVKTYLAPKSGIAAKTFMLNSSIILLPRQLARVRLQDDRVGYFTNSVIDFDMNPQSVVRTNMVLRWRLEPRENDIAKYLKGELVEPKKPIVFYIDPATPKKWIPYLIQGVNAWQVAFEKAGFKNAIYALEAPLKDTSFSLEDACHNVILYKASDIENASGPNINDPRTGEILNSHINWFHNVTKLLHDWYMIQAGIVDSAGRKMNFDDTLMGKLISMVCTHEVGHTIGLMHNFGASSTIPVDSLRSRRFVSQHGFCPSIMDYARFNYVAQPSDGFAQNELIPRIGEYDLWAIKWGYTWFPSFNNQEDERTFLNKWVIDSISHNKYLWWGFEGLELDPRAQSEDLGDNAAKAGALGIENLKRTALKLKQWTKVPNEGYQNFTRMHKELVNQYLRYLMHAAKNIGGLMSDFKTVDQSGPVLKFVSRERQKEAVAFLHIQLFNTPKWLFNQEVIEYIGRQNVYDIILVQTNILKQVLSLNTLSLLLNYQIEYPSQAYTIDELLNDLESGIFKEVDSTVPIELNRRNLQKIYVNELIAITRRDNTKDLTLAYEDIKHDTDIPSIVKDHLTTINKKIKSKVLNYKGVDKMHLNDLSSQLDNFLNHK